MVKRYYIDLEAAQYGGNFKQFELMIEDADGEFVTHSDYAALLTRAEDAESELSQVKSSGIEAMRRAEAAEKERDELASSIHAAMERYSSHEKKQSINQLVADVAYLKRLSKEHYAESKRLREALEIMVTAARNRENVMGDPIGLINVKRELREAVDIARAALGGGE